MIDSEIAELFDELNEIIQPEALERLKTLLSRIYERMEQLTISRDNWALKYKNLKKIN